MPIITVTSVFGVTLYSGEHADLRAAIVHCAAAGVALQRADLRGAVLADADISGLFAPSADLRGAVLNRVVANRLVSGRPLVLSAAILHGATFDDADLTVARLECTHPTSFRRVKIGTTMRHRGSDWSECPHAIVMPVRDDRIGRAVALYNGTEWIVHAGERGVLPEAMARTLLEALANGTAQRYRAAFAYLTGPEGQALKAAIEGA